jgi:hypothetical protein
VLTNNTFVYVATNGLTPADLPLRGQRRRYRDRAEADVTLGVVERRGTLNTRDDFIQRAAGQLRQ